MSCRKECERIEASSRQFDIPKRTERIFRAYLELKFPEAEISYEAESFSIINEFGKKETTTPDFRIVKPDGKRIFVEITKSSRNGTDPKERNRRIMKQAAPKDIYIVLYNKELKRIQRECPGFEFFKKDGRRREKSKNNH